MIGSSHPGLALPKSRPRIVDKREQAKAKAAKLRRVLALVRQRDTVCRVCGKRPTDTHHLVFRSHGGKDTTANLFRVCRMCHEDLHARIVTVKGTDANKLLKFERHD